MNFNNPIFNMELRLKMKNVSVPVFIMLYNLFFALISIISLMGFSELVYSGWSGAFFDLISVFFFLGTVQCFLVFLLMPICTADMIVGERERGTLDLLLSSPISPTAIVLGKLNAAIFITVLFSLSSFPILSVGFSYGGIGVRQTVYFFLVLCLNSFLCGAIGLLCSSLSRGRGMSIAFTFLIEFFLTVGNFCLIFIVEDWIKNSLFLGEGLTGILLFFNPCIPIIALYDELVGTNNIMYLLSQFFHVSQNSISYIRVEKFFLFLSIIIQILLGVLFLYLTVRVISDREEKRISKKMWKTKKVSQ